MTGQTVSEGVDIYVLGVGGQGIGLLVEAMMRAADYAGFVVKGVDTHGLAQRGGTVVSCLRVGQGVNSPLIAAGCANVVIALEANEAARGIRNYLRPGGTIVYCDTELQTLSVRLGKTARLPEGALAEMAKCIEAKVVRVKAANLPDSRMQNMAVLGSICREKIVPGVGRSHFEAALADLLADRLLEANLKVFADFANQSTV